MKHLRLTPIVFVATALAAANSRGAEATLTAVGDLDRLTIGQAGFCGDRSEVGAQAWKKVTLRGDEQVWLFAKSTYRTPSIYYKCEIERTFVPASGKSYILRVTHELNHCNVELFRVVPGEDPARERLLKPEGESCLAE